MPTAAQYELFYVVWICRNLRDITTRTTADGQSNANLTNLAIKGLIGIRAMAEISSALGEGDDAERYRVRHPVTSRIAAP